MPRIILLAAVCLFALEIPFAWGQQPLSNSDINNLLTRIRDQRASAPSVQADFREDKNIHLLKQPLTSVGRIWYQAPNKFRREVTGNSPSVTVSNGSDLWIYYPNFKSTEHYSLGKRSPVDAAIAAINTALNLENVENTFHISGRKTGGDYELQLLPRAGSMKRMFQRFDLRMNDNLLVERTEMLQPNGDRIVTAYSNPSRAPVPATTFEFVPPAGTDITTPLGK